MLGFPGETDAASSAAATVEVARARRSANMLCPVFGVVIDVDVELKAGVSMLYVGGSVRCILNCGCDSIVCLGGFVALWVFCAGGGHVSCVVLGDVGVVDGPASCGDLSVGVSFDSRGGCGAIGSD